MVRLAILAAALCIPALAAAQTIYTGPGAYIQSGQFTYGPNGSTQQHLGQFTYVNPGNGQPMQTYHQIGNFTYGPNGTTHQQIGSFGYGSDGSTSQTVGNFTYIHTPDGRSVTCQHVGQYDYCN